VAILVASSAPLDQFLANHPDYFFGQSPESGIVDPNNLIILTSHLKCSAFELPFRDTERFGVDATGEILKYLEEHSVLHHAGEQWHWMSESYPAEEISLRSASPGNFVILNRSDNDRVIGETDFFSAPMLIHEGAIYLHESAQYQIEELDWEGRRAYAKEVDVDYYTDAHTSTDIQVLDVFETEQRGEAHIANGEVKVTTLTSLYKKIKMHTHENVGWGKIHLPEQSMHTTSFWLEFRKDLPEQLRLDKDDLGGGLRALSNVMANVVPLFVMCDPKDIRSVPMVRAPFSQAPTIYIYDNYPGGVGLTRKMYVMPEPLLASARDLIEQCGCEAGCPSCVGPSLEVGPHGKETALRFIGEVIGRG
jgi:DEAD/DEAH box helicase domain-containing protein